MKIECIVPVALVLLLGACTMHKAPQPAQTNLSSQVLVERPEDNGVLNIRTVDVIFDDQQDLSLLGGQAASAYLEPGKHSIRAESPQPYDPKSTNKWKTESISFNIGKGETKKFLVCGVGNDAAYTHWEIRKTR